MWATVLETIMIVLFGASWPFNVIKSLRSKTAKGKSVLFLSLIIVGYVCGIVSKICLAAKGDFFNTWLQDLLFGFYCFNLLMVGTDFVLYFRNKRLDTLADKKEHSEEQKTV